MAPFVAEILEVLAAWLKKTRRPSRLARIAVFIFWLGVVLSAIFCCLTADSPDSGTVVKVAYIIVATGAKCALIIVVLAAIAKALEPRLNRIW